MKTKSFVYVAVMSGIMVMGQVAMIALPNIEIVSLLIMMYTLYNPKMARMAIGIFILVEGLLYGFGLWWFTYLYVWYILHFLTLLTKQMQGPVFNALLSGFFGLLFGPLTSIPYIITGGIYAGIAYMISGIPFDIIHCIGNFILALILYVPLDRLFSALKKQERQDNL